jgi:hypothetical protein
MAVLTFGRDGRADSLYDLRYRSQNWERSDEILFDENCSLYFENAVSTIYDIHGGSPVSSNVVMVAYRSNDGGEG